MALIKNEIPILEFDSNEKAVIMPGHERFEMKLPKRAVLAFLGDCIDKFAEKSNAKAVNYFISETKKYPVYILKYKGEEICLVQAPVGAPAATQILDWLISYGVKTVISAGSCGVLEELEENLFLVPNRALRDEGTSYHYAAPSRFIDINKAALKGIKKALAIHNLKYTEVTTWSTDGFFRETREKVEYRKSEGCSVVEMECSALAACAQFRKIIWGEILFTADSLADAEKYDERSWGEDSFEYALRLCLDAVTEVDEA